MRLWIVFRFLMASLMSLVSNALDNGPLAMLCQRPRRLPVRTESLGDANVHFTSRTRERESYVTVAPYRILSTRLMSPGLL